MWNWLRWRSPRDPNPEQLDRELDREIAERKRAEQGLRYWEAAYTTLIESLPLNIFRKDLEGRIISANPQLCKTLGRPVDEVVGHTDHELFPASQADKYLRHLHHLKPIRFFHSHVPCGK